MTVKDALSRDCAFGKGKCRAYKCANWRIDILHIFPCSWLGTFSDQVAKCKKEHAVWSCYECYRVAVRKYAAKHGITKSRTIIAPFTLSAFCELSGLYADCANRKNNVLPERLRSELLYSLNKDSSLFAKCYQCPESEGYCTMGEI